MCGTALRTCFLESCRGGERDVEVYRSVFCSSDADSVGSSGVFASTPDKRKATANSGELRQIGGELMPRNGIKEGQVFKVRTMCDFGEPFRADVLCEHKTFASAGRQYPRIWGIYGRMYGYRVWQEEIKKAERDGKDGVRDLGRGKVS